MSKFRYDLSGNWYKGNTHVHSTVSDGGKKPQELWDLYAALGYDFIYHTDHGIASSFQRNAQAASAPLLVLDGVEIAGPDPAGSEYHVVCLGQFEGLAPNMPLAPAMELCRRQGGMLILAHPHWTGNSSDDALRHGFDGVEVYNHVCWWLNAKGEGANHWDWMLARNPNTLGLASDDCHNWPHHLGIDGGWIVVNAARRTPEAILASIRAGNFYSSQGPKIHSLQTDGKTIKLGCSPARVAYLIGPTWRGAVHEAAAGATFTEHTWEIPADWAYIRLQIEDADGKRAWTNTLFV